MTVSAVVVAVLLAMFLLQLKRTVREAEKSFQELQIVLNKLEQIEDKLDKRLEEAGEIVYSTKKAVSGLGELSLFLTTNVVRPASKFWPVLFPLLRFGWQFIKKRKEKKNVG
ncbi:MAG: hypothetical protein H5U07_01550 [Candidatus Aminicenantes bacterium]|nr:hypothetical protein [Candidatus Aminicenantes bacterium]